MKIGIVSDTHDNLNKIRDMAEVLKGARVDFLLHAGDFIAPFSIPPLNELNCDWLGVLGNNDGEIAGLDKVSGGRIKKGPYSLELDSKRIILMHQFRDMDCDILIFGHTHEPKIEKGDKLIVNPGEVCGWVSGKSSLVLLDLNTLKPEIIYF